MAYLNGGFFSFIGKAIKSVAHVVGKVAGTALGVASVLVPGPAGAIIGSLGGKIAGVKAQVDRVAVRYQTGMSAAGGLISGGSPVLRAAVGPGAPPGLVSKMSPVMPGGAIATVPALNLRPKRASVRRRTAKRSGPKRRSNSKRKGRKLKFGSAAYRKKYLGHR